MAVQLFPANCTVTGRFDTTLPVEMLTEAGPPRKFDARVIKCSAATFLVFRSGRLICVGAKDPTVATAQFQELCQEITKRLQAAPRCPPRALLRILSKLNPLDIKVRNLVLHGRLPTSCQPTNLAQLGSAAAASGCLVADYTPELYPVLRLNRPHHKGTMMVFASGKLIVTGVRDVEEANSLVQLIQQFTNAPSAAVNN